MTRTLCLSFCCHDEPLGCSAIQKRGLRPRPLSPGVALVAPSSLILHVHLRFPNLVGHSFGALLHISFEGDFLSHARLLIDHSFLAFPLRFDSALLEGVLSASKRSVHGATVDRHVFVAQSDLLLHWFFDNVASDANPTMIDLALSDLKLLFNNRYPFV